MEVELVRFNRDVHWGFIRAETMNAADKWPHCLSPHPNKKYLLLDIVRRATVDGRIVMAVVPEDPLLFVGFLVWSAPQTIAYAYVKYACRRMGVATKLAEAAWIDLSRPIGLEIWTPAASRIAAAGRLRLYPVIPNEQEREHEQRERAAAEGRAAEGRAAEATRP